MICKRCAGAKKVRGPGIYDEIDCPACEASGQYIEEDQRTTLRPPPKPPDNRARPQVDMVECLACIDGRVPFDTPLGVPCERDCPVCKGQRIVTPEVRHAWISSQKK